MARLSVNDLDGLMLSFKEMSEMTRDVIEDILDAQAEIVVEEQRKTARSMGVYDEDGRDVSQHVADSITAGRVNPVSGGYAKYVYPRGSRIRMAGKGGTKTIRNAEIAFLNEYGTRKQPARPFIRTANEACASRTAEAAEKAYKRFLDARGL